MACKTSGEVSPVKAPSSAQWMFWDPMATLELLADWMAACRSTKEGQMTIWSRSWLATRGRKAWKKSRVWSGVLYIFQLPAISFVRGMGQSFEKLLYHRGRRGHRVNLFGHHLLERPFYSRPSSILHGKLELCSLWAAFS